MVYWLGKPSLFLPKEVRDILLRNVSLIEMEMDISVLTIPDQTLFFFYADTFHDNANLLLTMKICMNLSKKIVLFHHETLPSSYVNSELTHATIDLSSPSSAEQTDLMIEQLKTLNLIPNHRVAKPSNNSLREGSALKTKSHTINITQAIEYINENFSGDIRESKIAEKCHISTQHFSRCFHNIAGQSFRDYLQSKRLDFAKSQLIKHPNKTITEIAYQSGYNDVSYFSRIFKKKIGVSPGNFRFEYLERKI